MLFSSVNTSNVALRDGSVYVPLFPKQDIVKSALLLRLPAHRNTPIHTHTTLVYILLQCVTVYSIDEVVIDTVVHVIITYNNNNILTLAN